MKTQKKLICFILLVILAYFAIAGFTNTQVLARERTENLSGLNEYRYRGILPFIQELQIAYPNWSFTILYTGLDWNSVINAETISYHGRSLTQNTHSNWICSICGLQPYDSSSGWYCASRQAVEFYIDPRNWINGKNIFSFETLSYDANIHTIDGVEAILRGSFMDRDSITYTDTSGNLQTIYKSYAQIIMEAAVESGVSPYHLASRLRQEQGLGNSALISGTFVHGDYNFTGYYNYFNIGASGNGDLNIIINGLRYASSDDREYKWTSPELAIKGGAKFIASGYIGRGQDTLYLEKYNVDTDNIESAAGHQYMQNISAHISEGLNVYRAYNSIGVLNNNFNFIIPVYENMPSNICPRPTTTTNLVTENVMVTATVLNLRESNSTGSTSLASLSTGTQLLRIETAKSIVNGYYWDKVIYFTNNQAITGYVARDYITQVGDYITTEEIYYTSTGAILKNGPGVNCEPKAILDYGTELIVIDKMTFAIDNIVWYRVRLADGTQGYVASNFIVKANTNPEIPTGEVYKIEGEYIYTIPGVSIEQIEGATLLTEAFVTGARIRLNETEYTLIMLGDVNADGQISPADYVRIKNNIMETTLLEGIYILGADVNRDNKISPADYVRVKNHIMGITNIIF